MRIVFMGTPEFAAASLEQLLTTRHEVVGVFTQPDKPKGRGYKLVPPPVKELALAHHIPVFQPQKMRDGQALEILQQLQPELIAVVGLDTGDMILKKETPIGENETYGELHDRLAVIGAQALVETVDLLEQGKAPREKQDDALSCYAPMLDKKIAKLDFAQPATKLHDLIRGLSPWPVAHTTFEGKLLKVHRAVVAQAQGDCGPAGKVLDSKKLIVACGSGALELQPVSYTHLTLPTILRV